jgi:hypothetical protein
LRIQYGTKDQEDNGTNEPTAREHLGQRHGSLEPGGNAIVQKSPPHEALVLQNQKRSSTLSCAPPWPLPNHFVLLV